MNVVLEIYLKTHTQKKKNPIAYLCCSGHINYGHLAYTQFHFIIVSFQ